jgi:hypothetical protein
VLLVITIIIIILVGLGFELFMLAKEVLYCLSHISSSFYSGYFGHRFSRNVVLVNSLISAFHVARFTDMSLWLPASSSYF